MTQQQEGRLSHSYDVVVIGGGAAGLSGALSLARSRRSVVVIDAGEPRNAPAEAVHVLLGHDGIKPTELVERGRAEVRGYGGEIVEGRVVGARADGDGFEVELSDGRITRGRRLLVTTGLVDELPPVPGLAERWGHDVLHCPYCHGWEVRDQAIGVLTTGPMSVHQALLFSQLSDRVTLLTHEGPMPDDEQAAQLAARGVHVTDGAVVEVEVVDDALTGVRLADGSRVPLEAIAVGTRMVARADFLGELGLQPVAHPSGMGVHLPADPTGRSAVPGVWVAGNVADLTAQVGASSAQGVMAGAQINYDLVLADIAARQGESS